MFLEIRNYIAVGFALMLISPAASVITELQKSLTSFLMIRFIARIPESEYTKLLPKRYRKAFLELSESGKFRTSPKLCWRVLSS